MSKILKMDFDNDKLCHAIKWYTENSKIVIIQSTKYLIKFRKSRPIPRSPLQKRLNEKSLIHVKESVMIDYAVQHLNFRMVQFVLWFQHIMGKMPSLSLKTYQRLINKYPYKKTGFGRCVNILGIT
tara:strand:+ start:395 stop:772 length:378 start_codon:yes stop_codon:yes gene_type:complete